MVIRLYYGNSFPITKKGAQVLTPSRPQNPTVLKTL